MIDITERLLYSRNWQSFRRNIYHGGSGVGVGYGLSLSQSGLTSVDFVLSSPPPSFSICGRRETVDKSYCRFERNYGRSLLIEVHTKKWTKKKNGSYKKNVKMFKK